MDHFSLSILTFSSTNIDDLLLLSLFFSLPRPRYLNIILGQYLGMSGILLCSFLTAWIGSSWLPVSTLRYLSILPIIMGAWMLWQKHKTQHSSQEPVLNDQILPIAVMVLSGGSDNISVYIPLLAQMNWKGQIELILTYLFLTGAWCGFAFLLTTNKFVRKYLEPFTPKLLPYIFILLGLYFIL